MNDAKAVHEKARAFFENLWQHGDPWELERSEFEQAKYDREISLLGNGRYEQALEIGCGAGVFSDRLAALCDDVLAIDLSPTAISRARKTGIGGGTVEFREVNIMDFDPESEGPWDLVIINETIYYLGWLYSFFDVAWLAHRLFASTANGGTLLMANTYDTDDYLMRPAIIRTYRDLFVNVGYSLTSEEVFQGTKNGVQFEVLMSLLGKAM